MVWKKIPAINKQLENFRRTEEEKIQALKTIEEVQSAYDDMIVTEVKMFEHFYKAEANHQDYYNRNSEAGYCTAVINPKLDKLKKMYKDKLKRWWANFNESL